MNNPSTGNWNLTKEIVRVKSQWMTLVAEIWRCDKGQELEYWRVEKVDSVIVLPIHDGYILTAKPTFRPGVGRTTLDFPGGRLPDGMSFSEIVPRLLERELGVPASGLGSIRALNSEKWTINSSFSNQGLWAFTAELADSWLPVDSLIGLRVTADQAGIDALFSKMDCLQCRAVLSEWERQRRAGSG